MSDDPCTIQTRATAVASGGTTLRAKTIDERAQWLANAAAFLAREDASLGRQARRILPEATGLTGPMVNWALQTTLDTVQRDSMVALAKAAEREAGPFDPLSLLSVVLAGNVFTASVRGIVVPLLFGTPVLVKASSRETRFPLLLRDALRAADADLGRAMDIVAFAGGDLDCEAALLELADAVSVYGGDETVSAIDARLGGRIPLITHGHGVSVAYCGSRALDDDQIGRTIDRVALDVCAYDQRGCLSPQVIYVQETPRLSVDDFAVRLAEDGLERLGRDLPRGSLPDAVGAAQAQWRGVAEVEGRLVLGGSYALSVRRGSPVRWSPGYRNATLVPVAGVDDVLEAAEPFAPHLKCIGADPSSLAELDDRLRQSRSLSAYACALGTMQTPALEAPADGRPIWEGLFHPRRR